MNPASGEVREWMDVNATARKIVKDCRSGEGPDALYVGLIMELVWREVAFAVQRCAPNIVFEVHGKVEQKP